MIRTLFLVLCLCLTAPAARAQSVQDQIVSQLQAQGFTRIEVNRTFLGRIQLKAYSRTLEREMVFNPNTGEILRDYWEPLSDNKRPTVRVINPGRGADDDDSSGRRGGSDDDDDRDEKDDRDDKDDRDRDDDDKDEDDRDDRDDDDDDDDDDDKDDKDDDDDD